MYFMASQLQQLVGWGREAGEDPVINLVTMSDPLLKAASHMEMDLPSIPHSAPTGDLLRKVWREFQKALKIRGSLPFTPVWNNPRYSELHGRGRC